MHEQRRNPLQPALGLVGPPVRQRRPGPGHHERDQQGAFIGRVRNVGRLGALHQREVGIAGLEGELGEAPACRQHQVGRTALQARFE